MAITVSPETFSFVSFDPAVIGRIAAEIVATLGLGEHDISIEVDETTPLARTTLHVDDAADGSPPAIRIRADSGAFEDTRKPRQQSETATTTSLGRVLLRARDRLTGGFAEAPADDDLSLAQIAAWETYSVGRLERLGVPVNRQRWLYNFRNRHSFTDAGDTAFQQLWRADGLTWADLCAVSDSAAAGAAAPIGG
ncbi:MAG: hypothetical protein ABIW84_09195 [Ilumatobacteraceae bacterium]